MDLPGGTRDRGLRRLGLALVVAGVLVPPPALAAEHTSGYGQMPPPPKTTLPPRMPTTGTSLSKEEKTSPEKTTSSNELATSKAGDPTTASGTRAVEGAEAGRPGARAARLNLDTVTSALAKALRGFGLIGPAGRGGLDGEAIAGLARAPATHAERVGTRTSSGAKDPLGLELPPETGQAMMVALIVLATMLLLAVLFADKLRQLLERFAQRPRG